MTKARIIQAVREARGEESAQLIDHLKKDIMAREAARLLEGSNWLPEPLRLSGDDIADPVDQQTDDEALGTDDQDEAAGDLPAFLKSDAEPSSSEPAAEDGDESDQLQAAE